MTTLILVGVWAVGLAVLGAVVLQRWVPANVLILAPAAHGSVEWYTGFVTAFGILGWSVAGCSCAATAHVAGLAGRRGAHRAFGTASVLMFMLLIDELFLLHSVLLPHLLPLSSSAIQVALGGVAALWLLPAWPEIRRTRWELLAAAGAALGASMLIDLSLDRRGAGLAVLVAEDGCKFLGVLALAAWGVMTARDIVGSVVRDGTRRVDAGSTTDQPGGRAASAAVR